MTDSKAFLLLAIAGGIFLAIALFFIIKGIIIKRYNRKKIFGYDNTKTNKASTGVSILDNIVAINPSFMTNGLEKTNLCKANRVDPQTGQQLSIAQTLERYPEEKVRLHCYYRCLLKYGMNRVDVEFPLQVGSKKCFIDVVVFYGDGKDKKQSKEHTVLNLQYIFECKKNHANPNNKLKNGQPETMDHIMKTGLNQLKSYMAVCPNLIEKTTRDQNGQIKTTIMGLGCITNGAITQFYKKKTNPSTGNIEYEPVAKPSWY